MHLAAVGFVVEEVRMKPRILLLMLLALVPARLTAQQQNPDPDSKQEGLAVWARLKLMTQSEFQELVTKAQSGDAAAQYQVGLAYDMGKHVTRNTDEAARLFLKSAEPPVMDCPATVSNTLPR